MLSVTTQLAETPAETFDLRRPTVAAGPLVFASPHSGTTAPDDFGAAPRVGVASLRSAEDAFVDRLIAAGPAHGAPVIAGRISRAYVDLNRAPDELDPELIDDCATSGSAKTTAGFGVIPRRAGDGTAIYDRRLSRAEALARIETAHRPYHDALGGLMIEARDRHGLAILIDWHSMPSWATANPRRAGPTPSVVLGDRHGTACDPRLTRRLRGLFEAAGWRVALNQPYAGGYSTQTWGRPVEGFHAIQVELNRALYLDEARLEPGSAFEACRAAIDGVIAGLAQTPGL